MAGNQYGGEGDLRDNEERATDSAVINGFNTLEKFRQRKMFPGEALPVFLHDIKQLLEQAMPGLDAEAKEQLLLHQFVAGLPPAICKPQRAAGNTTDLRSTVERAKLLNALENEQQTAGVTPPSNVNLIPTNAAIEKLTEQDRNSVLRLCTGKE